MTSSATRMDGFPADFVWGCSNASYQSEGSIRADGRGDSIWDVFCRKPGAVAQGHSGEVACDSWNRMSEDVALLKGLGLGAYRFSIAWPRVQPEGSGRPIQSALDAYARFADLLLEAGIEPWVTIYHWDLPEALEEKGGWLSRDTSFRLGEFAAIAARALGGRVRHWVTLNEPWCSSWLGYGNGEHAPGIKGGTAWYEAAHHLLLGHGLAVEALRAARPDFEVGITLNPATPRPATRRPEDVEAAHRASVERTGLWLDPIHGRGYPAAHLAAHGVEMPVQPGDLERIAAPIDFLGINYYNEDAVMAVPAGPGNPEGFSWAPTWRDRTAMGWTIVPEGLSRMVRSICGEWPVKAVYVTENGAAFEDATVVDGRVRDTDRIAYLRSHVAACGDCVREGLPLKGYFAWTIMDNFEWSFGYTRRFGLVQVDRATGERRPKDSYYWYRDTVAGFGTP